MRLIRKLVCWLLSHDWEWKHHDDRPSSLLCQRCGKVQERGLAYLLDVLRRN